MERQRLYFNADDREGAEMKIAEKFGKYTVATFIIMGIGLFVWLISLPLYAFFNIDTDIFGAFIFLVGLILYISGLIVKRVKNGSRAR